MGLQNSQKEEISNLLLQQIRRKLSVYNPETNNMPFHVRLLGKDRMALFSFIQSINTTLGTSVFEQVAAIIAKPRFTQVIQQYKGFNDTVSQNAQHIIQEIMDNLISAKKVPNKEREINQILSMAQQGEIINVKRPRIDLFLEGLDGTEYYFDLKTAKPNLDEFKGFKRKLLEWVAIRASTSTPVNIKTMLAIPYNPYEPAPYQRWTLQGLFDLQNEILVADEFWNFLGGENTYPELLDVFEQTGITLRPEIDTRFSSFPH